MDRHDVEARLERLVRENRFTISVFFPLNGAVLLVASAEGLLPAPLSFNPLLILFGTLVMRSPLVVGVLPLVARRAALALGALVAYSYAIEYIGVHTGYPYGEFFYGVDLGPTLYGVPLGLPVFFIPLVMNAYLLVSLLLGEKAASRPLRLVSVIAAVLAMDLVLDPGAVALGFWVYPAGGLYYGVPLSNYAGWVLSATVAVVALDVAFSREALLDRLRYTEFMLDDLVSFVILWGGINAWFGNWAAVAIAAVFGVGLVRTERFDSRLLRVPRPRLDRFW
ncbi:bisanhydrobacterioruberin hydratase [Salinigranum halophilum]|jgi:putative membrane protein|uniref:bisanhydrobacterioruberin hydratase n=1 Tax=Salinigranum halophilum TaxID=2565931 RepID=UPI00115F0162|nr:bisanhydrobacterioruberin hydratase [Salinigranum halophilum]